MGLAEAVLVLYALVAVLFLFFLGMEAERTERLGSISHYFGAVAVSASWPLFMLFVLGAVFQSCSVRKTPAPSPKRN
jgi:hypothetical protein